MYKHMKLHIHTVVHNIMCVASLYSQAEAVLLRDFQHFLLQVLTRLSEKHRPGEGDGPLIGPLKLIVKLELGKDGRMDDQSDG